MKSTNVSIWIATKLTRYLKQQKQQQNIPWDHAGITSIILQGVARTCVNIGHHPKSTLLGAFRDF